WRPRSDFNELRTFMVPIQGAGGASSCPMARCLRTAAARVNVGITLSRLVIRPVIRSAPCGVPAECTPVVREGGLLMTRRLRFALATLVALVPAAAGAQTWPGKQPIRVIIPFTAGSATDIVARTVMEQVSSQIGQAIVVENRLGAGGTLGIGAVAKAEPDGYTFLAHSTSFAAPAPPPSHPPSHAPPP